MTDPTLFQPVVRQHQVGVTASRPRKDSLLPADDSQPSPRRRCSRCGERGHRADGPCPKRVRLEASEQAARGDKKPGFTRANDVLDQGEFTLAEAMTKVIQQFRLLHTFAMDETTRAADRKHSTVAAAVALEKWMQLQGKPSHIIRVIEGEPDREAILGLAQKLASLRATRAKQA